MRILHISDIHYRKQLKNNNVYESILANMDSSLSKLDKLFSLINDIDCICITGDLCDDGTVGDYKTLRDYLDSLNIPYFVCLGNHDDKKAFYKGFYDIDYDGPYLKDEKFNGIHVISFDNSEYGYPNGYLDETRLNWLRDRINNQCIVLMHHQLYDLPGIPAISDSTKLKMILDESKVITVLNGHTHWYKQEGKYYTAPSISFRAKNEEESVVFYDCFGYCLYDVDANRVKLIECRESQSKLIGKWNPKKSKLY